MRYAVFDAEPPRARRGRGARALAFTAVLVVVGMHGGCADSGGRCLTPDVGHVLENLVATGALKPILGTELTLGEGGVRDNRIELGFEDPAHRPYRLRFVLPESREGAPDGEGHRFLFYVAVPHRQADPRAVTVLLAIAAMVDQSIPEAAISHCGGGRDVRLPRALALASGAVQLAALLIATIFGSRTVAAMPPLSGGPVGKDAAPRGKPAQEGESIGDPRR